MPHSEQLMVEFLWMWDYICYSITDLDRAWRLQEAEAPRISRHLADEVGKVVSPAQNFALFPADNRGFYSS